MTDAEVKNVEIGDQVIQERDEITANLTVGVPVLADDEFRDGISIRGDNVDLEDRYANIDLSVTLSVEESQRGYGSVPTSVRTSSEQARSNSVPAYKDTDALRNVYEQYDTFPEMTEALGVDVTPGDGSTVHGRIRYPRPQRYQTGAKPYRPRSEYL